MSKQYQLLLLLLIGAASAIAVAMVAARFWYSGRLVFHFLIWNLCLAWIPLLLALVAQTVSGKRLPFLGLTALWLLFFPNSLYIVTDLIHLNWTDRLAPIWYDALMIFTFAITGLILGFSSLALMHGLVERRLGVVAGWLFAGSVLSLSSVGVYIGRFLRWNSWDIFFSPGAVTADLFERLIYPRANLDVYLIPLLLTLVFSFIYLALLILPQAAAVAQE